MTTPKLTLIFLLYNGASAVPALVRSALSQTHSRLTQPSDWLEVIFMDDGSRDGTLEVLRDELARAGNPSHVRVEPNPRNLGLSATLNRAFSLVRSPYALTCHLDCIFGRNDYLEQMLSLMESHPDAAVITGQPAIDASKTIPFAEKVNLVGNLMDLFPVDSELTTVGFAERRCDVFRVEALKRIGFWDTNLRTSGEDQILCGKLRAAGYQIYQAPKLPYFLSVSGEQDSLYKLVKHAALFARTTPYLLFKAEKTHVGIVSNEAGWNRRLRTILRLGHLAAAWIYFLWLVLAILGAPSWLLIGAVFAVAAMKLAFFWRWIVKVRMSTAEILGFLAFQPLMDLSYTWGFLQGLWIVFAPGRKQVIR